MKNYEELIVRYFDNQLSDDERIAFEKELETNSNLGNAFKEFNKVNEAFSTKDQILADQQYFNSIIPRFRQSLDKRRKVNPIGKLGFAIATIVVVISAYLVFQNYINSPDTNLDSLQSITNNLSGEDIDELADYISDDSQDLLSNGEKYQVLDEMDFSLEGITANASPEEKSLILSDYGINDIYSLASAEELENAYNEILSKRIF